MTLFKEAFKPSYVQSFKSVTNDVNLIFDDAVKIEDSNSSKLVFDIVVSFICITLLVIIFVSSASNCKECCQQGKRLFWRKFGRKSYLVSGGHDDTTIFYSAKKNVGYQVSYNVGHDNLAFSIPEIEIFHESDDDLPLELNAQALILQQQLSLQKQQGGLIPFSVSSGTDFSNVGDASGYVSTNKKSPSIVSKSINGQSLLGTSFFRNQLSSFSILSEDNTVCIPDAPPSPSLNASQVSPPIPGRSNNLGRRLTPEMRMAIVEDRSQDSLITLAPLQTHGSESRLSVNSDISNWVIGRKCSNKNLTMFDSNNSLKEPFHKEGDLGGDYSVCDEEDVVLVTEEKCIEGTDLDSNKVGKVIFSNNGVESNDDDCVSRNDSSISTESAHRQQLSYYTLSSNHYGEHEENGISRSDGSLNNGSSSSSVILTFGGKSNDKEDGICNNGDASGIIGSTKRGDDHLLNGNVKVSVSNDITSSQATDDFLGERRVKVIFKERSLL